MNLLELPREIRDLILDQLFLHSDAPDPTVLYAKKWNTIRDQSDATATKVIYSSLPPPTHPFTSVLRVNRQLHKETKDAMAFRQTTGHELATLKTDLLLDDLTTYYLSWLRILPFRDPVVDRVHLRIRPFFALQYNRDAIMQFTTPPANRYPCQVALWRLGAVINGMLRWGPTSIDRSTRQHNSKSAPKFFAIDELVLEIQPKEHVASVTDENDIECTRIAAQQAKDFEEYMVANIESSFTTREGSSSLWHIPWGSMMLSRVRRLVIISSGKVVKELDVAKLAEGLSVFHYTWIGVAQLGELVV
jgi:hypothetical protein